MNDNQQLAAVIAHIKAKRKKLKLSVRAAADAGDVSYVHWCRVEGGRAEPSVTQLQAMAAAVGEKLFIGFMEKRK